MEPSELLGEVVEVLERLDIPYRITGSMASIAYGEPRFTNDIDIVVQLHQSHIDAFCEAFPEPDFFLSKEAMRQAVLNYFQFNLLHLSSGLKVDLIVTDDSPFNKARFSRGQRLFTDSTREAWFASPEDVILKKLVYFQQGGSEKHLRDIVGILKVQANHIEQTYLTDWIERLGVQEEWRLVQSRMPRSDEESA